MLLKVSYKTILFLFLVLCIKTKVNGQNLNLVPTVFNYGKSEHKGGTQTWDIAETKNGLVLFANNDGLLVYDGKQFERHSLPNNSILRSVYYQESKNKIFVGGQNEIGYFEFSKNGKLSFVSLSGFFSPDFKGFEDVWSIEEFNHKVYFQTSNQIFVFDGNSIKILKPSENNIENLCLVNQKLLITDITGNIFELRGGKFRLLVENTNLDISSILPLGKNHLLITTYKNGVFALKNNVLEKINTSESLKSDRIYKACMYGNNYVLATNRGGVFFMDSSGKTLNNFTLKEGLQNNNVLSVYTDKSMNVWLGLDNGIDLIRLNYPFGNIKPDGYLKGTGYCMAEFNNQLFFGTNNGLYLKTDGRAFNDHFKIVPNSEGQVWWTQVIENKLVVCHHEGLFEFNGTSLEKIINVRGCWKVIPLTKKPGFFLMGTYNGICLLKKENDKLKLVKKLTKFKESSRFLEEDSEGNIWIGHPYKGIYKLKLAPDLESILQVRLYKNKDGLPELNENYIFNTDLGLNVCSNKGVYAYQNISDKFQRVKISGNLIDSTKAYKRLFNGKNGNIWFISDNEIGYLKPIYNGVEYSYSKRILPYLDQNLVKGFEFLSECNNGNLFIGVETGFVNINLNQINNFKQEPPNVMVTGIGSLTQVDSFYYQYINPISEKLEIFHNSIEFLYTSTNSYFYKDLTFSSYLEGWDKEWSAWKSSNSREFSSLSYGSYTFFIKAKCMGVEGPVIKINIYIKPPWYWSKAAKFIYAILGIIIILIIGFYPQMLVRKKAIKVIAQKDDHYKKQRETLLLEKQLQEKELIELKNKQLQLEIEHQGKELASSTMHIVQKSEKLLSIKDKLKRISQITNDVKIKPELSDLIKNIDNDTLIDKDWEKFELYFNNIHTLFTKNLKEKFPTLSANDIKMCAYLRMNLSTKEIASILNISTRGVEISRYRLRKKMELESGINLSDYLSKI